MHSCRLVCAWVRVSTSPAPLDRIAQVAVALSCGSGQAPCVFNEVGHVVSGKPVNVIKKNAAKKTKFLFQFPGELPPLRARGARLGTWWITPRRALSSSAIIHDLPISQMEG